MQCDESSMYVWCRSSLYPKIELLVMTFIFYKLFMCDRKLNYSLVHVLVALDRLAHCLLHKKIVLIFARVLITIP